MPIEELLPGDHQDGGQRRRAAGFVVSGISLRSFPKQRNVQKLVHIPKHNELTLYNVRYTTLIRWLLCRAPCRNPFSLRVMLTHSVSGCDLGPRWVALVAGAWQRRLSSDGLLALS